MPVITNEQLLTALPLLLAELGIKTNRELHYSTWQLHPSQKILIAGVQTKNGKQTPVRLKMRVPGEVVTREKFVTNETIAQWVNERLFQSGLPAQRTLAVNFDTPPEWILREDIPGTPIGNHSLNADVDSAELATFVQQFRTVLDKIGSQIDHSKLNTYNWQAKWRSEFDLRAQAVKEQLGQEILEQLTEILSRPFQAVETNSLIHTDLAPPNILKGPTGLFAIDCGEASWGPKALDWIMVWSFAFDRPELRQMILKQMLSECQTKSQLEETKTAALMVASRMLASFAEWADFYQKHPDEKADKIEEAKRALPLAAASFKELTAVFDEK